MVYFILRKTLFPIVRAIFVKEVIGIENLPQKGPYIIAVNHSSYIDPILIGIVLVEHLNTNIHFVAMKPLAKYWLSRFVLGKYFKSIFVNGSVAEAFEKLSQGRILVIFPEGGRTPDGELQKIESTGTAVMANIAKVSVIPVAIDGTFELWSRYKKIPSLKKIVSIKFGCGKFFKTKKPTHKQMIDFIRAIMEDIAKLCKKRYYY